MAPAFIDRAGKQTNAKALIPVAVVGPPPVAVVGPPPVAVLGLAPPGGVVPATAADDALAFTVYPHSHAPKDRLYGKKNITKPSAKSNHRHA